MNQMLNVEQAAEWLGINPRQLITNAKGKIPACRINKRVLRFSPRMILAKMACEAGLSPLEVGCMFIELSDLLTLSASKTTQVTDKNDEN